MRRLRETIWAFQNIIPIYPFSTFSGILSLFVLMFLGILTLIGMYAGRPFSAGMFVWGTLNTFLLLSYRYDGGTRYIFPILIPISIYSAVGASVILKNINYKHRLILPPLLCKGLVFVLILIMAVCSCLIPGVGKLIEKSSPYSQEMSQVVLFSKENLPRYAKVAFFMPRAFRLLTGLKSIIVNEPNQIDRIDYYVFNKTVDSYNSMKGMSQLSREYFDGSGRHAFSNIFENEHYIIFKKHN